MNKLTIFALLFAVLLVVDVEGWWGRRRRRRSSRRRRRFWRAAWGHVKRYGVTIAKHGIKYGPTIAAALGDRQLEDLSDEEIAKLQELDPDFAELLDDLKEQDELSEKMDEFNVPDELFLKPDEVEEMRNGNDS